MKKIDYFKIIHKYIKPDSLTYFLYIPHVVLVTSKALEVATKLNLDERRLRFIKEASMLHDIGVISVNAHDLGCTGELDYICHGVEGRKILESEGLTRHAMVAERHTGVGLTKKEILDKGLPIPARNMLAVTLEEKIISWADLFYTKNPDKLWFEKTLEEVRVSVAKFGVSKVKIFDEWLKLFGS